MASGINEKYILKEKNMLKNSLKESRVENVINKMDSKSVFSIWGRESRDLPYELTNTIKELYTDKLDKSIYLCDDHVSFGLPYHDEYCKFRWMNMILDDEQVEPGKPTMRVLNFTKSVIGSDETGNAETFKPIVVVAACVENVEQLEKCIQLGVSDSKDFKKKKNQITNVVEEITGITTWEEVLDATKELDENGNEVHTSIIKNDFCAIRVITNAEFNKECRDIALEENRPYITSVGVKERVLKKAHAEVLAALKEDKADAIIVVDDFTDEIKKESQIGEAELKHNLRKIIESNVKNIPNGELYLTTKADSKIMAVALASMISSHISKLGLDAAEKMFREKILDVNIEHGAGLPESFLDSLKTINETEKMNDMKIFMENNAKLYYKKDKEQFPVGRYVEKINAILNEKNIPMIPQ